MGTVLYKMVGLSALITSSRRCRVRLPDGVHVYRYSSSQYRQSGSQGNGGWSGLRKAEHRERGRLEKGGARRGRSRRPERRLESLIGEPRLVDPLGSYVPGLWISVSRSSEGHGGDLALNVRPEASAELHYKSPGVSVSGVGDQGEEAVQVIVHRPVSLVVCRAFQSVNGICFCIDQKELTPELLFKVGPRLDRKNAGVRLLAKEVLRLPRSMSVFEKGKGPKDFLLITAELLWSQA